MSRLENLLEHVARNVHDKWRREKLLLHKLELKEGSDKNRKEIDTVQRRIEILEACEDQRSDVESAIKAGATMDAIGLGVYMLGGLAQLAEVQKDTQSGFAQRKSGRGRRILTAQQASTVIAKVLALRSKHPKMGKRSVCTKVAEEWSQQAGKSRSEPISYKTVERLLAKNWDRG